MLGGLGDAWRPDRSKLMIRVEKAGLVLEALGGLRAMLAAPVLKFIGTCIEHGVTLHLSLPVQPRRSAGKLPLNELLAPATDARGRAAILRELARAIEAGADSAPPVRVVHPIRLARKERRRV